MSPVRFFSIDDSLWPLLVIRLRGAPTDEHHAELLELSASYLRRREPYVVLTDMLHAGISTTAQRHRQMEWLGQHDKLLRESLVGMGFILDSVFLRLALNVTIHVHPPVCPYIVVPRMDQALAWAADRFDASSLRGAAERIRRHETLQASTGTR